MLRYRSDAISGRVAEFVFSGQEREIYEQEVLQLSKKSREGTIKKKSKKGGRVREEALLESKTHRRVSRRTVNLPFVFIES